MVPTIRLGYVLFQRDDLPLTLGGRVRVMFEILSERKHRLDATVLVASYGILIVGAGGGAWAVAA